MRGRQVEEDEHREAMCQKEESKKREEGQLLEAQRKHEEDQRFEEQKKTEDDQRMAGLVHDSIQITEDLNKDLKKFTPPTFNGKSL